jgi:hypothetical protein
VTADWEVQDGIGVLRPRVDEAMVAITGCEVNSDCPLPVDQDSFFASVNARLRNMGLCAGIARPGEDQIIVGTDRCGWHEAYHIFNSGGNKVVWATGAYRDNWRATDCEATPIPPPSEPPTSPSSNPPPGPRCPTELGFGKTECKVHNPATFVVDCTSKVCDRAYCDSVGNPNQCCSPGGGDGQWAECEAQLYGIASDGEPGPEWSTTGSVKFKSRQGLTMAKFKRNGPGAVVGCVPNKPGLCSTVTIP